jgi:phage tail-like protein
MSKGGLPSLPFDSLVAQNFAIEIGGVEIAQFSEVGGLTDEVESITSLEVDMLGNQVTRIMPGAYKPPTITLKRGACVDKALWDWHKAILDGKLLNARKEGSVVMKDFEGMEVARYNFYGAWVTKIEMSTLKAGSNEVLTESVSIVCEKLERVA